MSSHEEIEKTRQAIMRFRELLALTREKLEDGERAYSKLFASFSPEAMAELKEKDLQWQAAEKIVADVSPLKESALRMRFAMRDFERAYEELYDALATVEPPDNEDSAPGT